MKRFLVKLKMASPIVSWISLAGCIVLSITTIKSNHELKEAEQTISNYSTQPLFTVEKDGRKRSLTLLDILNQHSQQIDDLYNRQSNMRRDINRSNSFLLDYSIAKPFKDDFPMRSQY